MSLNCRRRIHERRKILIWIFVGHSFRWSICCNVKSGFRKHSIKPVLSVAPFGISLIVGMIAAMLLLNERSLFLIDDEKVEFRYGVFRPKNNHSHDGNKRSCYAHKEKKAKIFQECSSYIINLTGCREKRRA